MALNPETQFPGKIAAASAAYPFGQARNITTPNDGTGTPWEAALVNDIFGFQQALLSEAGLVPSGTPEKVGPLATDSQYLQSFRKLTFSRFEFMAGLLADTKSPDKVGLDYFDTAKVDGSGALWIKDGTTGTVSTTSFATGQVFNAAGDGYKYAHDEVIVTQFGAVHDGVTSDSVVLQAAFDYSELSSFPMRAPAGIYFCTVQVEHKTGDLFSARPHNGIVLRGDGIGQTIFQAADTLTGNVFLLDGNKDNTSDNLNPVVQTGNILEGFSIIGNGQFSANPLSNGLRIRANLRFRFSDIMIKEFTQHGLLIDGTTVAGKDDADTTSMGLFENFHCHENNSYGVLGQNSRVSTLTFLNCEMRNNTNDGIRLAYSGLRFIDVSFTGNGQAGNSTGGFTTIIPATGAISRGLGMYGIECENNFNHEVRLDYCDGFEISGSRFGAFKNNVGGGGQRVFKFGDASGTSVVRGVVSGAQIANLGNVGGFGHTVFVYDCEDECDGIEITNVGIGNNYTEFTFTSGVKGITRNGAELTTKPIKPAFSASVTLNAAPVLNVTGDGTVFSAASLFGTATTTEHYNSGDFSAGVFTAPEQGIYEFSVRWPITGFDGTETSMLARVTTSGGAIEILQDETFPAKGATDTVTLGGTVKLFLAKGETVNFALQVSGSASKSIDINRAGGERFQVSGNAI